MIVISKPYLDQRDTELVLEAVQSGWISSMGGMLQQFETQFSNFCQVDHAMTCSSGTTGLHLALIASGVAAGDEVIIPNISFVATVNAVLYCNAIPVFCDVSSTDGLMDIDQIPSLESENTKAIIPVHLYGSPVNIPRLRSLIDRDISIIEDCAEAHGAEISGERVGGLGDIGVFSFYGNKIMTTGEGGMVTTNDESIAERVKLLRDHGMSKEIRYQHDVLGFNYRMTNLQAALGVAQLEKIDYMLNEREKIFCMYEKCLSSTKVKMLPRPSYGRSVNWLISIMLPENTGIKRDDVITALASNGIDSRPFFRPMNSFPYIARFDCQQLPNSEFFHQSGLSLPTFIGIQKSEIEFICETLNKIIFVVD